MFYFLIKCEIFYYIYLTNILSQYVTKGVEILVCNSLHNIKTIKVHKLLGSLITIWDVKVGLLH